MSELLDWDGPWSTDLINAMIPVAVEIETKREQAMYRAALASTASMYRAEVGRDYSNSLLDVLKQVEMDQLRIRGWTKEDISDLLIERFARALLRMPGLKKK